MAGAAHARDAAAGETVQEPAPQTRFLNNEEIRLIRISYRAIEPAIDLVATLFFRRLQAIDPELYSRLAANPDEQRRHFRSSIALAVASLDRFAEIVPALHLLGARYRTQGITEFHYGAVGEALLWTLKQSLGDRWISDTADAWTALCTRIAEIMTRTEAFSSP